MVCLFLGWCIFVYNLAPETEENVLWQLFGPFGAVQSVKVVNNFQSLTFLFVCSKSSRWEMNLKRQNDPNLVVNISPFRWFAIYRPINVKVLALLLWRTTMKLSLPSNHSTATRSEIACCKWALKPTRPRLHKSIHWWPMTSTMRYHYRKWWKLIYRKEKKN